MRSIFKKDKVALVQKPVKGKDYRVVVLDSKVISAYERIPLSVIGDGKTTILKLLKIKQGKFISLGRDTKINFDDVRIPAKLERQGINFQSVPEKDQKIFLLDNANLSTGGDSVDVTDIVHKTFSQIAVRLTKDMGLRLCGVDLMIDGDISQEPEKFWILEISSALGLDHYAKSGEAQKKIVEGLYLEVLKSME